MRHFVFITVLVLGLSSNAIAQDEFLPDVSVEKPLSESEVQETFTDQTHRGTYNFEMQNFDSFRFEETTTSDGKTIHRLGSRIDTGTWAQSDNQICFAYDSPDLIPACFVFYQRGNCVYHYQQSSQGVIVPRFTAVSVIKGESPNCEPPMS